MPWAKAGLLLTSSTRLGSPYAAVMATGGHGVRMEYDYTHDAAGLPGRVTAASPRWLRLARSGDTITGYDSPDGRIWTLVGTAHLPGLPHTAQTGMFATSPIYTVSTPFFGGSSNQSGPSQATRWRSLAPAAGSRLSRRQITGGSPPTSPRSRP